MKQHHAIDGTAKTVNDAGGAAVDATDLAYLNMPDANTKADTNIRAVTIADYTFLVNRTKTVAMNTATAPARNPEALIFIKQGDYETNYEFTIGGTTRSHQTAAATATNARQLINTDYIADQLDAALTGYNVSRSGSVIWFQKTDTSDFTVSMPLW